MENCPVCGLPRDLCTCKLISAEKERIRIRTEKKRFGRTVTIIEGVDKKTVDIKSLLKFLKTKLACGGTFKDNVIELRGDHRAKVKELLVQQGFPEDIIETL